AKPLKASVASAPKTKRVIVPSPPGAIAAVPPGTARSLTYLVSHGGRGFPRKTFPKLRRTHLGRVPLSVRPADPARTAVLDSPSSPGGFLPPGQNRNDHAIRTGGTERPGGLAERAARSHHVIHQQYRLPGEPCALANPESGFHVLPT